MKHTQDRVTAIIQEIKRISATPAIKIHLAPQEHTELFASKLGGLPYWDKTKPYPRDKKGTPLTLLLQINLESAGITDDRLPRKGMLQFFILDDDNYGLDFDAPEEQNTFRVVYHERIDPTVTADAVRALGVPLMPSEYSPVRKKCALSFERATDSAGMTAFDFNRVFQQAVETVTGEACDEDIYDYFTDEEYKQIGNQLLSDGNKLFGSPFFTQGDPREFVPRLEAYYDTLLLQLDSVYSKEKQWMIWGDCGVAQFFINSEALKACDFSRVLYNWDCY